MSVGTAFRAQTNDSDSHDTIIGEIPRCTVRKVSGAHHETLARYRGCVNLAVRQLTVDEELLNGETERDRRGSASGLSRRSDGRGDGVCALTHSSPFPILDNANGNEGQTIPRTTAKERSTGTASRGTDAGGGVTLTKV